MRGYISLLNERISRELLDPSGKFNRFNRKLIWVVKNGGYDRYNPSSFISLDNHE